MASAAAELAEQGTHIVAVPAAWASWSDSVAPAVHIAVAPAACTALALDTHVVEKHPWQRGVVAHLVIGGSWSWAWSFLGVLLKRFQMCKFPGSRTHPRQMRGVVTKDNGRGYRASLVCTVVALDVSPHRFSYILFCAPESSTFLQPDLLQPLCLGTLHSRTIQRGGSPAPGLAPGLPLPQEGKMVIPFELAAPSWKPPTLLPQ